MSACRPRLLDLFCGGGGCSVGYHRAGFDVVGVDINPQPNYPFDFIRDDALFILGRVSERRVIGGGYQHFDAIHASPPCPRFSLVSGFHGVQEKHPDLIAPTRELLESTGMPWVMENVPGAPLRADMTLCGEMFDGLRIHRHRIFELGGWFAMAPPHGRHSLRGALTNCEKGDGVARWITGNYADHGDASSAMGIDWMSRRELANAIPPAYTEFIGRQLMAQVCDKAAA